MAIAMAAFTLAAGAIQFSAAQSAARRQEELAKRNQQMQQMETERALRIEAKESAREEGEARARAAASGVLMTGSVGTYLTAQQKANQERLEWIRRTGESRADIIGYEGKTAAQATRAQGWGSLASSVGGAYGYWSQR